MRSATTYVLAAAVSASCLAVAVAQDKPATPTTAIAWQKEIEISGRRFLAVGPRAVVVSGSESGLTACALDDGHVLWQSSKTTGIQPAVSGQLLAILNDDAIEVLDLDTGESVWRTQLEGDQLTRSVHATDRLFLVVRGTEIRAWRLDGAPAWQALMKSAPSTRIVASGDSLIVGLEAKELAALDSSTGGVRWSAKLPAQPTAVAVAGDQVFVPGADGGLQAFRLSRGFKQMWRYRSVAAIGEPVIGDRLAYFTMIDNTLKAFDRRGGSRRWSSPLESRAIGGPVLVGEILVVPLSTGNVAQIVATTGAARTPAEKSSVQTSVRMAAMAAAEGSLYGVVTGVNDTTTLMAWRTTR